MLKLLSNKFKIFLRSVRGEDLDKISKESSKQLDKMSKALSHLGEDIEESRKREKALEVAVFNQRQASRFLQVKKAKASVMRSKLEYLTTATPEEIQDHLD